MDIAEFGLFFISAGCVVDTRGAGRTYSPYRAGCWSRVESNSWVAMTPLVDGGDDQAYFVHALEK